MLTIRNLTLIHRGDLRCFVRDFTFHLHAGERAALIGEEGNGKSSLLAWIHDPALVEDYMLVSGSSNRGRVRTGYLSQLPRPEELRLTPRQLVEREAWAGQDPGRLARLAAELGLEPELLQAERPLATLSGGERVKLRLYAILAAEPDVLLLDEPSNDLDLPALVWLERFIQETRLPLLYVSHDEVLLERTANVIVHIEQLWRRTEPQVTVSRQDYRSYVAGRERHFEKTAALAANERRELAAREERQRRLESAVAHAQRVVSRQAPSEGRRLKKKMASVQATGRRLERARVELTAKPYREEALDLEFAADVAVPAGRVVLDWRQGELRSRTGGRVLAQQVELYLRGPEKVGIAGANGSGKSTLLGEIREALVARGDLRIGWMPQNYDEAMDPAVLPLDWLCPDGSRDERDAVRSWLGSARFSGEEMEHPLGELSGGQRAKLFYLRLIRERAEVLLLDEPTRNLSPLSNPAIRAMLSAFGGAILAVSHDRRFLAEVCTRVLELRPDGLHELDVSEWQA